MEELVSKILKCELGMLIKKTNNYVELKGLSRNLSIPILTNENQESVKEFLRENGLSHYLIINT